MAQEEKGTTIVCLAASFEAFGMVMDFMSVSDVFATFELGTLAGVVRRQLRDGNNLAGISDNQIVGYAGWLHTNESIGEEWMESRAVLRPLPESESDAAALTVVAVSDPKVTTRLMRGARELNKGKRIFFKRGYDGVVRPDRKSNVLNVNTGI